MKKIWKILLISSLVTAIGAAVIWLMPSDQANDKFRFDKITRGDISQAVTANGTLNPIEIASVGTQVSGTVLKLHAEVNDEVKKGQMLAEIDPQLLESSLKQQKSSLEITRLSYEQSGRDLKRARELFAKDYIPRVDVERAEQSFLSSKLSLESAEAQLERAQTELSYSKITSPIDGVIISKEVTEGQTVAASFQAPTLYRIAGSLVEMKIDVTIPESDIGMVKQGMNVTFTADAYPDKTFAGVVDSINLNPNAGIVVTYTTTVKLRNEDKLLLPGMTAYVNISVMEKKNVLRVPAAALRFTPPEEKQNAIKGLFDPSSSFRRRQYDASSNTTPKIHILRQGALQAVEIVPGMMDDEHVEIASGDVSEGDVVAVGFAKRVQ